MISKCNVFLVISVLVLAGSTATSQGTDRGNTLLTDSTLNFVIEIDESGTIVWEKTGLVNPHNAERLSNGNTLIANSGAGSVIEVEPNGDTAWSMIGLTQIERFWRDMSFGCGLLPPLRCREA